MIKTSCTANRAVLLLAALGLFITARSTYAQEATAQVANLRTSNSGDTPDIGKRKDESCGSMPLVKNLMALRTPPCDLGAAGPRQLTKRDIKKLTATAKSPEDHLKIAAYYMRRADTLDSEGAAYEEAAAVYRHGPIVKNLMAPNTAARFEYLAQGFREEARTDRALAASQNQMAKGAVAVAEQ